MIITIERDETKHHSPYIVSCGHDKHELFYIEEVLQLIANIANSDVLVNIHVSVICSPVLKNEPSL